MVALLAPGLAALPPRATVGVIYLVGSLCPMTRAHVLILTEGREMLLGREPSFSLSARAASAVNSQPTCARVLGLVGVNGDKWVTDKLRRNGEEALSEDARRTVAALSTAHLPWVTLISRGVMSPFLENIEI